MRFRSIALAAGTALCAFTAVANAADIQFEGFASPGSFVNVNPIAPYTEAGFTLTPVNSNAAVFDPADSAASFPGDSTAWLGFAGGNSITITGPAPFDLTSLDVGPSTIGSGTTDITISADIFGGGVETATLIGLTTDSTENLNWTGLQDVVITSSTDSGLDNINASPSAPEPGTMLLLAAGLGAVGIRRFRSRKA